MAIDLATPAASVAEYRGPNNRSSSGDDTLLNAQLLTCTRWAESKAGLAPGMLLPQTALTFVFHADGGNRLYLRDEVGHQYLLRAITADSLKIDSDGDGVYDDYLLDTADAWVGLGPVNNGALGEPYTYIDLRSVTGATVSTWPFAQRSVQIVGDWGCLATSKIRLLWKQRVIQVAREMIDVHSAGPAMTLQDIDSALPLSDRGGRLLKMMADEASLALPVFA